MILAEEEVTTTSSAGDVSWPLADNLGSIRDLIDEDGTVLNHIEYGVYGEIVAETDDTVDHIYGFTGRERDEESGLQYNRARYYDAVLGRWASEDPIGFLAGDPNISRYVGNDPANFVDRSGGIAQKPSQKPFEWLTDSFEFFDNVPTPTKPNGNNTPGAPDTPIPSFEFDVNRPGFSFGLGELTFNGEFDFNDVIDGFWKQSGDYLDGLKPGDLPDVDQFGGFFADAFFEELDVDVDLEWPSTLAEVLGWGTVLTAAGYGFDYLDDSPFRGIDFTIPGPKLDLGKFGTIRPTAGRKGGNNAGGFEWGWDFRGRGSLKLNIDKTEGRNANTGLKLDITF